MEELFYRKTKSGWICRDRYDNETKGATKQIARNLYVALYGMPDAASDEIVDLKDRQDIFNSIKGD